MPQDLERNLVTAAEQPVWKPGSTSLCIHKDARRVANLRKDRQLSSVIVSSRKEAYLCARLLTATDSN